MLKNCFLYRILNRLGRKWSFRRLFQVSHPDQRSFCFLFSFHLEDVSYVLRVTKPTLPETLIVALEADGNVLSEEVHVQMAEYDVSILFQSRLMGLAQQGGPLPRSAKHQNIVSLRGLYSVFETAAVNSESDPAVKVAYLAFSEMFDTE